MFVFRVGHLGDTLIALPALAELRKRYPAGYFKLITNRPAEPSFVGAWEVLRHTGMFDEMIDYATDRPASWLSLARRIRRHRGPKTLYYLAPYRDARQIRRDRFFFRFGCGFNRIIGDFESPRPGRRGKDGALERLRPEWSRLHRVVSHSLTTDGKLADPPLLVPPAAARTKAARLLAPLGRGAPAIAIGPGSKMPAKRWFRSRFEELGARIMREHATARLVIVGGPEDRADGEAIARALDRDRVVNLAGHTNIIESAAVLERCDLYVGNDTGTMHLAAVMGVRCVAIFTSRDNPGMWDPFGRDHAVLRRDLDCSGCMLTECIDQRMRCLDEIDVNSVWSALQPMLLSNGIAPFTSSHHPES